MTEEFIPDATETPAVPVSPSASPKGVNSMIHTLYRLRFASVREWNPLQPTANPGEVVSILKRQLFVR